MPADNTDEKEKTEEKNVQATIDSSRAFVYASMDTSSRCLGTISEGTRISVVQAGDGWYQITEISSKNKSSAADIKEEDDDTKAEDAEVEDTTTNTNEDEETDTADDAEKDEEKKEVKKNDNPLIGGYIQQVAYVDAYGKTYEIVQIILDEDEETVTGEENIDQEDDKGEDGDEKDEEDSGEEDFEIDDAFAVDYLIYNPSPEEYKSRLDDNGGLTVNNIRGIFGCPHQFLPVTDIRSNASVETGEMGSIATLGRLYTKKIISQMPLLLITPGVPHFMSSFSKTAKTAALKSLLNIDDEETADGSLVELVSKHNGKYYSLKYSYREYFWYLNAMLRSAAIFLGIDDVEINGEALGSFQWLHASRKLDTSNENNDMIKDFFDRYEFYSNDNLDTILGPYSNCLPFYADCGNTVDDSFSNSTTQSQLSSAMNSLSDTGRELNFIIGNVGSTLGLSLTKLTGSEDLENNQEKLTEIIDYALGGGNILSNILNKCQTILAGGRLTFPEIWADSSFNRSYSCKMKLVSPSGDKLSIFLNILVPFYHILALTLPRQSIDQSYFSPFLVRAYSRSLFNVDMGIITDLNITKGSEGEWTKDGLPTVAEISFTIKDMYDGMFMSSSKDLLAANILSNITELDYIANSCGVNINDQEVGRTVKMYLALNVKGALKDTIQIGVGAQLEEWANQKMNNLFGVFR